MDDNAFMTGDFPFQKIQFALTCNLIFPEATQKG